MTFDTYWEQESPKTPTLDRIKAVSGESQTVYDFLEWLRDEKGIHLAEYKTRDDTFPSTSLWLTLQSKDGLLHEYFKIDAAQEERERRHILEWIRCAPVGK